MSDLENSTGEIRASLIKSGGILPSLTEEERKRKPSLWLYIASLVATFATLYVTNYNSEAESFRNLTYGVAIIGYALSYYIRWSHLSLKAIQVPLIICLCLIVVAVFSSESGMRTFIPEEFVRDRQRMPHLFFLWLMLGLTFTLTTDAALLFLCVPCVALIALITTLTPDTEVYYAFLAFVGATTFLMIHENYLRSRSESVLGRTSKQEKSLFHGQAQMAFVCVLGSLFLAQFVSIPLRLFGHAVSASTNFNSVASQVQQNVQKTLGNKQVGEQDKVEIATGPVSATNIVLMEVTSPVEAYWRGTSFDAYDGRKFYHATGSPATLKPLEVTTPTVGGGYTDATSLRSYSTRTMSDYVLLQLSTNLYAEEMIHSSEVVQKFRILGGSFTQVYGAGVIEKLNIGFRSLSLGMGGGIGTFESVPINAEYTVTSRVADSSPETLRNASNDRDQIPLSVSNPYLGVGARLNTLEQYVAKETAGLTTNYDKVIALKKAIARDCKYSLQAPKAPPESDVVENFLLTSKVGYCDSFGAALTILCRYADIPARLVSGFLPGMQGNKGTYQVRDRDKHLWTEVFFPKVGWVTFDATEGSDDISDYNLGAQKANGGFFAWLRSQNLLTFGIFSLIGLLSLVLFMNEVLPRIKSRNPAKVEQLVSPNLAITKAYRKLGRVLEKRGVVREVSLTYDEYALRISERLGLSSPEFVARFLLFTEGVNRYRYSNEVADRATIDHYQKEASELATLLKTQSKSLISPVLETGA